MKDPQLLAAHCLLPTAYLMKSGPLKLALVTRRYPPLIGGAEKVLSYLANALAAEGADVTVITSRIPGLGLAREEYEPIISSNNHAPKEDTASGRLRVVRLETSRLRFWGTWRYMQNLKRWFQQNRIDLAYVSMLKHDAYTVVQAGEQLGFPVVLRPEGAGVTGDVAWQSWGNLGRVIGYRCRRASAFVIISKTIEHELREAWDFGMMRPLRSDKPANQISKEPRIVMIPNGVPIPSFTWQPRSDWQATPRAVFIGRLAHEKGLDTLVEAWPLVRAKYPTAKLTFIGEGPLRPILEQRIKALGMTLGPGQPVEIPGALTDSSKALREADLFVLPSREEGMSIALLEAMAIGIPLVVSSIPGNCQLVSDFEHGRITPPNDPWSLARVISEQWDNFNYAIDMGRAARARVDQEFSIQTVACKHLALFKDILDNRARA